MASGRWGWRTRRGGGLWSAYSFASFAIVFATGLLSAIAIAQGWSNVGLIIRRKPRIGRLGLDSFIVLAAYALSLFLF